MARHSRKRPPPLPKPGSPAALPVLSQSPESRRLAQTVVEELWFGDDDPVRSHLEASTSLAATTALVVGLKPFPVAAQRVLRMSRDPEGKVVEMCRVIESDPGLVTRVLRVANSALYAPTRPVSSIEHAVIRLGMRSVAQIVVALLANGMFDEQDDFCADVREHSVGVSVLARRLALDVKSGDVDDLFLSGILHDIGKLLAMQSGEFNFAELGELPYTEADELVIRERRRLGWDHAVLGAHVIEQWQLPRNIAQVVAFHHQPARAYAASAEIAQTVAILRLADRIEYQMALERRLDEGFVAALVRSNAFEYTHYSGSLLQAAWSRLVEAVDEGRSALR